MCVTEDCDERAEAIKRRVMQVAGGYDDLTLFALLRAMADETGTGESWTELDLRRLANAFWLEG